jgi:hypothetical protein
MPKKQKPKPLEKKEWRRRGNSNLTGTLNTFMNSLEDSNDSDTTIKKLNVVLTLVHDNIKRSLDLRNFDTSDIKLKYQSTQLKDKTDLKIVNSLYNKHKKLSALMS